MRCFLVIDSLKVGGAEMLALGLARAAIHAGWSVDVGFFTPGSLSEDFEALGVPLHRISRFGLRDPLAAARVARLISRIKPDVVHTHLTKADVLVQPVARVMRVWRRVVTWHNIDAWRRRRVFSVAYRAAISGAHEAISVSREVQDYAVKTGAAPRRAHLRVIENGVEIDRFRHASAFNLDAIRSDAGDWPGAPLRDGAPEAVVVAVVGRMDPQKNHRRMVDAARIACDRVPGLRFVFAGDGVLRPMIALRVNGAGLADRILMPGVVRDVPGLLSASDMVAFSSDFEGLPMAMLEAMAAGRPVVATPVGAIPDVLKRSGAGLVASSMATEDLASALVALAQDPERRRAMGAAGQAEIEARYSEAAMTARILACWRGEGKLDEGSSGESDPKKAGRDDPCIDGARGDDAQAAGDAV